MKRLSMVMALMVMFSLWGCATFQDTWSKASSEEKARIIIYDLQITLKGTIQAGAAYVNLHPEKRIDWKAKVLPVAELANKTLRDYGTGGYTYDQITTKVAPMVAEITSIILAWGVAKEDIEVNKIELWKKLKEKKATKEVPK